MKPGEPEEEREERREAAEAVEAPWNFIFFCWRREEPVFFARFVVVWESNRE